jgi:hypothetical protein
MNPSWGRGFKFVHLKRDCPSPRGGNSRRVKILRFFFKIFFSRTSRTQSIKLGTNYPWVKGIQVCSNKGSGLLQKGDN